MNIYEDIAQRTGGNIYIGVVGPVRTGKSTFIKRFSELMLLPSITDEFLKQRTIDELPQSAAGKTIMTAEPKFIPEEAVKINIAEGVSASVKLIDCVGYIIPSAVGYIENDMPRMVMTPWFEKPIPFNMAAEIGTKKVIEEHSTIGIAVSCDGSFGELPRNEFVNAEKKVVDELKALNKPFALLINTANPEADSAIRLTQDLQNEYGIPVIPVNCLELTENDVKEILSRLIFEFPIRSIGIDLPDWVEALDDKNSLKCEIYGEIKNACTGINKIKQIKKYCENIPDKNIITDASLISGDLGKGKMTVHLNIPRSLYYKLLSDSTGLNLKSDGDIMRNLIGLSLEKNDIERYSAAIKEAQLCGYGVVPPKKSEFSWNEPEIIKQGGRYGISLKAKAPSVHIIRADIETEISPIVGTQEQSQGLINYLTDDTAQNPEKIWDCDIFGKSLYELTNDGFKDKLEQMPTEARGKMQETLQRVINEGADGLICIIV